MQPKLGGVCITADWVKYMLLYTLLYVAKYINNEETLMVKKGYSSF